MKRLVKWFKRITLGFVALVAVLVAAAIVSQDDSEKAPAETSAAVETPPAAADRKEPELAVWRPEPGSVPGLREPTPTAEAPERVERPAEEPAQVASAPTKPEPTPAEERFHLEWTKADAKGIEFYINTTLPDEAEISLSAVRTYKALTEGKLETYSHSYFEEKGPLSKFRLMTHIPTDDGKWSQGFKANLDKWARLGIPSEVRSISSDIEVTAYAYAHKTGPRFGAREYPDLISKIKGREIAGKSEIVVTRPMANTAGIPRRSMMVAGRNLEVGQSYRLLRERTPLMPSLRSSGTLEQRLEQIARMRDLPAGTLITVTEITSESGTPFYRVVLPEHGSVKGWINSIALLREGVRRVSGEAAPTRQTAHAGLRAEVWAKVLDPCLVQIVRNRGGVRGLTEAQAVEFAKTRDRKGWDDTADNLVEAVKGQPEDYKKMFFGLALTQCVAAGK